MMTNTHTARNLATITLFAFLAACSTFNKEVAAPPVINGNWASTDNIYTASFNNGRFVSKANDTGGILSEGNYVMISENKVQISWFGKVSGKNSTANCNRNGSDRLDCVDSSGRNFSLVRAKT